MSVNNLHDHEPDCVEVAVKKVVQEMKTRARSEATSIPKIYAQTIRTACEHEEVTATLPTFNSIRTSLYQSRRQRYPPMPESVDDLDFSGEWAVTDKNETFYHGCRDGVFLFTTENNLDTLSRAEMFCCDGTFSICPRLFYQVFTIHCFKHDKLFPMVYFLLPNKTRETYNNDFLLLKQVSQNYGFTLMPACVKADYELPLVQSVQISFPSCAFKGCYYHFAQAIWRKVQNLGLASAYRHPQSEDKKSFRKVISLPFVPVSYVRMAWDGLKHCMPSGQAYDHFVDYFEGTWLNGNFSLSHWNVHLIGGPRTNNNLEGWHSRVKTLAGKIHLNIFEIVELFKTEQSNMEASILQLASGGTLRSKGVSRKRKEERIRKIQEKFDEGDYTLEYLGALYRWVGF